MLFRSAFVDSCLHFGIGGSFDLAPITGRDGISDFEALFSESQARAIIAVPEAALDAVYAAAEAEDVPAARIGTTGGDMLVVTGTDVLADIGSAGWVADLDDLRILSENALRTRF